MVYPTHWLLQFGGPMIGGEIWSCGLRLRGIPAFADLIDQQSVCDDLFDDVVTWMQTAGSGWSTRSQLEFAKFNQIDANGHYVDQENTTQTIFSGGGNLPAGTDGSDYPNQVALAITWTTAVNRGLASKGRLYIPTPIFTLQGGVGISPLDAQSAADAARQFIVNVNNQPGFDQANPLVASVVSRVGAGTHRPITGVRVGRVLDTIRRRRSALQELPVVAAGGPIDPL